MYLFKYFHPSRTDVIENSTIRLTQPVDFNDPFEFKPVISTIASKNEFQRFLTDNLNCEIEKTLSGFSPEIRKLITREKLTTVTRDLIKKMKS